VSLLRDANVVERWLDGHGSLDWVYVDEEGVSWGAQEAYEAWRRIFGFVLRQGTTDRCPFDCDDRTLPITIRIDCTWSGHTQGTTDRCTCRGRSDAHYLHADGCPLAPQGTNDPEDNPFQHFADGALDLIGDAVSAGTEELRAEVASLRAENLGLRGALTKLRNVADDHIDQALGPIDEVFVFDTAYVALSPNQGEP
jgi:hypothetical protein